MKAVYDIFWLWVTMFWGLKFSEFIGIVFVEDEMNQMPKIALKLLST